MASAEAAAGGDWPISGAASTSPVARIPTAAAPLSETHGRLEPPVLQVEDSRAREHLQQMLAQSLQSCKVNEELWKDPIMVSLDQLASLLTPERLATLSASQQATTRSRGAVLTSTKESGQKTRKKSEEKELDEVEACSIAVEAALEARREAWRGARLLLVEEEMDEEESEDDRESRLHRGHPADVTTDSSWSTIAELPKVTVFELVISSTETSMGAVKNGVATLGVEFVPDQWLSTQRLFGADDSPEFDAEDLKLVSRVGGTFKVTSLPKDRPRLERLLELLAFATISLRLETYLLEAMACPRLPLPIAEPGTPESNPTTPTAVTMPERPTFAQLPSEEWSTSQTSRRKRVAKALWGALLGSSRQPPPPATASHSTYPSSSSTSSGPPSSSTSPPSSDSSTPVPTTRRVKDRIRGFGESFGFRRHRGRGDKNDVLMTAEDSGWDFLASVGLSLSAPKKVDKESSQLEELAKTPGEGQNEEREPSDRFEKVLKKMSTCILSTSPDVLFPPPFLLLRMAQSAATARETPAAAPSTSLLPPPSNRLDAHSLALDFTNGHIGPVPLNITPSSAPTSSAAARMGIDVKTGLASLLTNNNSLAGVIRHQQMNFLVEKTSDVEPQHPCTSPHSRSFAYYQSRSDDVTLGQFIQDLVQRQNEICEACQAKELDHTLHLMHGTRRVSISLSTMPISPADLFSSAISAWTTCSTCQAQTSPRQLSNVAASYSFGKWLELLVYDGQLVPSELGTAHEKGDSLVRCFRKGDKVVNVKVDPTPIELYELRLPAAVDPEVRHRGDDHLGGESHSDASTSGDLQADVEVFFASVDDRLDRLREAVESAMPVNGPDTSSETAAEISTRPRRDSNATVVELDVEEMEQRAKIAHPTLILLDKLRRTVNQHRVDCTEIIGEARGINASRSYFRAQARAVKRRLTAWETKHSSDIPSPLAPPTFVEPDYFASGVHLIPVESSVVVREAELSSLIALTLSAQPFQAEILSPSAPAASSRNATPSMWERPSDPSSRKQTRQGIPSEFLHPAPTPSNHSSRSPSPMSSQSSSSSMREPKDLDPDDSDADFTTTDEISFFAKRRKRARPGSRMMGTLSRQRSSEGRDLLRASSIGTPTIEGALMSNDGPVKPVPALSDSVLESLVSAESTLELPTPTRGRGRAVPSIISSLRQPSEATTSSTISVTSVAIEPAHTRVGSVSSLSSLASFNSSSAYSMRSLQPSISEEGEIPPATTTPLPPPTERGSRFLRAGGTITSTLSSIMSESIRRVSGGMDEAASEELSEHVKFAFASGSSSFRVTVWYAERYADLRTKCGLPSSLFIDSLERCSDLKPSGGKSSAGFFITNERRFLLKELVNAWGVSERDSFLSFAPKLLDYCADADRPSLLAKIFGFYTVKISKGGEVKKMDLIVMENIFYGRSESLVSFARTLSLISPSLAAITRQFDLKGIKGRAAKPKASAAEDESTTGWDHDWLSSQSRFLLHSHSKVLLRTALENDVAFLTTNGAIDYSLLLGVDDEKKELVVGLIDTLGVFDLRKKLESQLKTGIKLASRDLQEPTVIPPARYASRFSAAMESSFVAVPDAWTKADPRLPMDPDPRLACPI